MQTFRYWNVGQGAVGLLVACQLPPQSVALKLRETHGSNEHPANRSLAFELVESAELAAPAKSIELPIVSTQQAAPELVIAALKAYDIPAFIDEYRSTDWGGQPPLLLLSYNGILSDEDQLYGDLPVAFMLTTHGAYRNGDRLIHAGMGATWLATSTALGQRAEWQYFVAMLTTQFAPVTLLTNAELHYRRWWKLAINCLINPLTAIHSVTNGALLAPRFTAQLTELAKEFCQLAEREGLSFQVPQLLADVRSVATATATNRSSMLRDVEAQRRTEIDALNGFLVSQAKRHQLSVPLHSELVAQMTQLTDAYLQ